VPAIALVEPWRNPMSQIPEVGAPAPDFLLPSHLDVDIELSSMRGTKVAILFYPFDFSPG
jgi:peroxiredoxin